MRAAAQSRTESEWRVCFECGDRYRATRARYHQKWCSAACRDASIQRQRRDIYKTWWGGARWFIR